jgi:hypothetical protein
MSLAFQLRRLARHSAIYGLGGLVSRILATLLLPLYTHYLPPDAYGRVEIVTAATAVLAIALQMGIASAFFRFTDAEPPEKLTVVRVVLVHDGDGDGGLVLGVVFATISHWIGLGTAPGSSAPGRSVSGPRRTTSSSRTCSAPRNARRR